jgi:glycosyltransferase involved in cell wall biosynthesis
MKIAFLTARPPFPLNAGNRIRTFHLLRRIAKHHEVTLLTAAEGAADRAALDSLAGLVPRTRVQSATVPPRGARPRVLGRALLNPVDPLPYTWAAFRHPALSELVRSTLGGTSFDLVHCDSVQVSHTIPDGLGVPLIFNAHNVEHVILERLAPRVPAHLRPVVRWQAAKTRRAERAALRRFDAALAVSDIDRRGLQELVPGIPVHLVPNGVDLAAFVPSRQPTSPTLMLFTGALDWLPNGDAATFFVREVLPRIRRTIPTAEFRVVGRNPSPALASELRVDGVSLLGSVDDVRPHLAEAGLFVVPLRIGGGTRLKILEAWAMGKAVLSTSVGAEGLPAENHRNIVIEDDPAGIAERAVSLLRDASARRALGVAGRQTVEREFSWDHIARLLMEAYDQTLARRQATARVEVLPMPLAASPGASS